MKKSIILFFLILNFIGCKQKEETPTATHKIPLAEVPITVTGNGLVYIEAKVNTNENAYNFLFDTGAESNVLDGDLSRELGVLSGSMKQNSVGGGASVVNDIVYNQEYKLPPSNILVNQANFVIADGYAQIDNSGLNSKGIIGYSLPRRYITKVDYDTNKMTLYHSIKDVDTSGYIAMPFTFENDTKIPQFDIEIELTNGNSYKVPVIFDSGADIQLLVDANFDVANNISNQIEKRLPVQLFGTGGVYATDMVAIKSLKFNKFRFNNVPIMISKSKEGLSELAFSGALGVGILSKFNYILDYITKTLYLKPNASFENKFKQPLSGFFLRDTFGKVFVTNLKEGVPAYKAGLREGDQVLSMNSQSSKKAQLYYTILENSKEGEALTMTILQEFGKEKTITFKLQKMI